MWIFFAFPIAPRRLILLYQKNIVYTTIRLTFFIVYYKILLKKIGKMQMKKIINFRPILFILLSLCCGIATAYFFMLSKVVWGVFFIIVFVLPLLMFMLSSVKKGKVITKAIFSCIFILLLNLVNFFFCRNIKYC